MDPGVGAVLVPYRTGGRTRSAMVLGDNTGMASLVQLDHLEERYSLACGERGGGAAAGLRCGGRRWCMLLFW